MIPALFAGLSAAVAAARALPGLARAIKSVFSPTGPALEVSPSESDKYVVFTYDKLGELIGVNLNQTPTESYTFDKSGNLTSLTSGNTTTSFSYNSLNQQTAPAGQVFDAKGQTTTTNGRTYEWDDQGRITAIVMGTQRTELAYDGMSRRTKITEFTNGAVTSKKLYFWLGGSIVAERDGLVTGFPLLKRYFGQGEVRGTTKLYYCTDHLGSVRELVDSTGAVRAEYRYSTYGEQSKASGDLDSDWGYAGLWHHQASGLDLGTFRAYDASNKRWISRDPLGEGVDRTLYSYCWNNPINASDPSGLGPGSEPGPDYDPNITVTQWVFGSEETRDDFLEFTAWTLATELGLRFIARAAGGSARCKTPTKNPFDAARRGDTVHYDELNGRPGTQSGPTAIQSKYPDTEFQFAKQGEKGVDVRVVGGKMPWDYQGSNWPKGVRTADIKPGNANGFQTFMKEMKNGKIPAGSIPLPYNTDTLKVHVP